MKTKLETLFEDIQTHFDNYPRIGPKPDIKTQVGEQKKRDDLTADLFTDVSACFVVDSVLLYYDVMRFPGEISDKERETAHNRFYNSFLMYLLTVRIPIWKSATQSIHESPA